MTDPLLASAESSLVASDLDAAKMFAGQAATLAEATGDRGAQARGVTLLARVLYIRSETADAMSCVLKAIDLSRAVGDLTSTARAHEVAARILLDVGETAAALEEGLAAMRAADTGGDLAATMAAMRAMANVYAALHQWDRALAYGERYHETARLLRDPVAESAAIETVSFIYAGMAAEATDRGERDRARAWHERTVLLSRTAMLMARDAGNRRGENTCLANLAESLADVGRPAEALELLDSWPADPALDSVANIVHHRETRGIVLAALGRRQEAAELLTVSVAEAPTRQHEITARRALAGLLEDIGDLRGALEHYKRLFVLVSEQMSEQAERAASVAAVRLETAQAQARATALQRSNEHLNRQALEDPLTGLPNRRRLDQLLASDLRACSVVLLDVDHFKRINDGCSHLVGDAVLRDLAGVLAAACGPGGTAVRFGGEEFALVVQGTAADGVLALAERARAVIAAHDWTALAPGLAVTASFGVALGDEAATGIELLALADHRLLAAKASGRNRVVGPALTSHVLPSGDLQTADLQAAQTA
ncbi:GGDEF domain-containing protein [Dactylosporangium sp. NPDC005555]|uniref:GGDEF domain-containing protein n=1 Tax=Dactylosporangium sp. NPDC005555 TaxID=3154889 RepID=UPI0033AD87DD